VTAIGDNAAPAPQAVRRGAMCLTAFFSALVISGLGHVLTGHVRRGLLWFATAFFASLLAFAAIVLRAPVSAMATLLAIGAAMQLFSIGDAVYCGLRPRWHWGRWWGRGIVVGAVLVASFWAPVVPALLVKYAFEGFISPTNAMLPAIAGNNLPGKCTSCGNPVLLAPPDGSRRNSPDDPFGGTVGVCPQCGIMLDDRAYTDMTLQPREGDRFLVNKWLTPRRWDIIAFRYPEDPSELYAKRLVGLSGERVELIDGEVTIDGRTVAKPEHLQYLHYVKIAPAAGWPGWGQEGKPVTLGTDEYFVLGDFSARSRDSRGWEQGAVGHAPFAVPRDHIVGVATHVYWPVDRWRLFERAAYDAD